MVQYRIVYRTVSVLAVVCLIKWYVRVRDKWYDNVCEYVEA